MIYVTRANMTVISAGHESGCSGPTLGRKARKSRQMGEPSSTIACILLCTSTRVGEAKVGKISTERENRALKVSAIKGLISKL